MQGNKQESRYPHHWQLGIKQETYTHTIGITSAGCCSLWVLSSVMSFSGQTCLTLFLLGMQYYHKPLLSHMFTQHQLAMTNSTYSQTLASNAISNDLQLNTSLTPTQAGTYPLEYFPSTNILLSPSLTSSYLSKLFFHMFLHSIVKKQYSQNYNIPGRLNQIFAFLRDYISKLVQSLLFLLSSVSTFTYMEKQVTQKFQHKEIQTLS